tara:strand:- start:85677 stop:85982 length:306 start_codon:yes stop_codon:yes gene_type:complete
MRHPILIETNLSRCVDFQCNLSLSYLGGHNLCAFRSLWAKFDDSWLVVMPFITMFIAFAAVFIVFVVISFFVACTFLVICMFISMLVAVRFLASASRDGEP